MKYLCLVLLQFASVDPRYRRSLQKCPYPGCAYYGQKILKHIRHHQVRMKYKCDQCSFTSNFTKGISTHKRKHAEHDAEVVAAVINTEQQGPLSSGFAKAPSKKRKKVGVCVCVKRSATLILLYKESLTFQQWTIWGRGIAPPWSRNFKKIFV